MATNRYRVSVDNTRAYLLDLSNNTSDNLQFSFYQISTNNNEEVKTQEDVAIGGNTNFTNFFDDITNGQSYVLLPLETGVYQLELTSSNGSREDYDLYLSEHTGSNIGRIIFSVSNSDGSYTPSHYPPTNYTLNGKVYAGGDGYALASAPRYHWCHLKENKKLNLAVHSSYLLTSLPFASQDAANLTFFSKDGSSVTSVARDQIPFSIDVNGVLLIRYIHGFYGTVATNFQIRFRVVD